VAEPFAGVCELLGLDGEPAIAYRPRSRATTVDELMTELGERLPGDLERGFSGHGPHRDEVSVSRLGRELRSYGSQGQQRLGLLGWLLAEREALADRREAPPVMLLDDVMSELDAERREALIELLRSGEGQSVITATDSEHVPGAEQSDVQRLEVQEATVHDVAAAGR
jgi:DNA replication and repair protein RecF